MARPRSLFAHHEGPYGSRVSIREPKLGAPLRWSYRVNGKLTRPQVMPEIRVRTGNGPTDPVMVEKAKELCRQKHAELTLAAASAPKADRKRGIDADTLTVAEAYALFNDPARRALPASVSAQQHHAGGRRFWERELEGKYWNDVVPADIEGPLGRLVEEGLVQTAVKRLQTLRTMTRWLQRKMRIKGLEDPTIGIEAADLLENYMPKRPRFTPDEVASLKSVVPSLSWRSQVYYTLLIPSGTRAIQARNAWRTMLDAPLEPPVPKGMAPNGWIALAGVKGQLPHVVFFTKKMRAVIVEAIAGPLAKWEAKYLAGEIEDYPLVPGGRVARNLITMEPVSDRILRYELTDVLKAAGIKKTERMGFHAARRAWSDLMGDAIGAEAASDAGGWTDDRMHKTVYRTQLRYKHYEMARQVQEETEDE